MKFDTQMKINMPNTKISKPEVLTKNKMAAAAAILKTDKTVLLGHLWSDFDEIWHTDAK